MQIQIPPKKQTQRALREQYKLEQHACFLFSYFVNIMNNYKNNSILEIRNKVRQRSDFVHFEQYMKNNTVFQENCSRVIDIFIQFTDCEHLVSKRTFTKKEFDKILHDHISCFIYIHPWIVIMSDNNNNNNNNNKFDKFDTFKQHIINCPAIIMMNIKTTMPYIKKKTTVSSLDEQYKLLKLHIEKSTLLYYQFFVILASTFNNDIPFSNMCTTKSRPGVHQIHEYH